MHHVAFPAFSAGKHDFSAANRLHRSSDRGAIVRSQMGRKIFKIGWNRDLLKCEVIGAPNFSGDFRNDFCRRLSVVSVIGRMPSGS